MSDSVTPALLVVTLLKAEDPVGTQQRVMVGIGVIVVLLKLTGRAETLFTAMATIKAPGGFSMITDKSFHEPGGLPYIPNDRRLITT